jgi:arabinofuranosyltransferase
LNQITILQTFKVIFLWLLAFSLVILVFLKNAWVTEDAYILFRSLDQLFAGNGPNWNPHERVQVFTSPLWYAVLALGRMVSQDMYLMAIVVSLVFVSATVFVLQAIVKQAGLLLLAVLILISSNSFFDYTSSGLENTLAYFVIAAFVYFYLRLFAEPDTSAEMKQPVKKTIFQLLLIYGLLILVRHDLALLLLPAMAYTFFTYRRLYHWKQWLIYGVLAFMPFILYSLFSLLYYGFLFPNTAYAKLNTGIPQIELLQQGLKYILVTFKYDVLTPVVILLALLVCFLPTRQRYVRYLGLGLVLNLLYVVYVGGDFMLGRFLSYAFLLSVIILAVWAGNRLRQYQLVIVAVLVTIYATYYDHTPANSPIKYKNQLIEYGVADERGFYFNDVSLYSYIKIDREKFPHSHWRRQAQKFNQSDEKMIVRPTIGIFGYYAGIDKIIIDPFALADPLLARLPAAPIPWRIGHFGRYLPAGYEDSVRYNRAVIADKNLNAYYKKLKIITQSDDLFSYERLKTILLFNLGAYDDLIDNK